MKDSLMGSNKKFPTDFLSIVVESTEESSMESVKKCFKMLLPGSITRIPGRVYNRIPDMFTAILAKRSILKEVVGTTFMIFFWQNPWSTS